MNALMSSNSSELELFQRFMNAYGSISNANCYSGSMERVKESDAIIVLGTRVTCEAVELFDALQIAYKKNTAKILYVHPLEDVAMQDITAQFMKYEPGTEEGVMALFANYLLRDARLAPETQAFLDDLDLGYLEAESNIGEEEFEAMLELLQNTKSKIFVIGNDIMAHERAQNIAKMCALIEQNSSFSFLVLSDVKESFNMLLASEISTSIECVEELPEFNGTVIYNIKREEAEDNSLRGSAQFARVAKISDGDFISVSFGGQTIQRVFKVQEDLKGTIAINPTFDITVDPKRYKFERSQINKINQNSESNDE